jgi:hypothetical protein
VSLLKLVSKAYIVTQQEGCLKLWFIAHVQSTGIQASIERVELLFHSSQMASLLRIDLQVLPISASLLADGPGVATAEVDAGQEGRAAASRMPLLDVDEFGVSATLQLVGWGATPNILNPLLQCTWPVIHRTVCSAFHAAMGSVRTMPWPMSCSKRATACTSCAASDEQLKTFWLLRCADRTRCGARRLQCTSERLWSWPPRRC